MLSRELISSEFSLLQGSICNALERLDGKSIFTRDQWSREGGGGGLTRAIISGKVIEKGCVNFSAVYGLLPEMLHRDLALPSRGQHNFYATGISVVMHPLSPMVPVIHMNVRYFEVSSPGEGSDSSIRWFGGGMDLTPHFVVEEDAVFFHRELKKICERFGRDYPEFKKRADDYFFIPHRNETRGVGGIFFDMLKEDCFDFVLELGKSFIPVYSQLVQKNKHLPFTEKEKQWQLIRRGRYAEFNLVYDKGTRFGLETKGRTESILLSLPPQAQWIYNNVPSPGSNEEKTLAFLKKGINWV